MDDEVFTTEETDDFVDEILLSFRSVFGGQLALLMLTDELVLPQSNGFDEEAFTD